MKKLSGFEKMAVIVSDVEMGAGDLFDDFTCSAFFSVFLNQYLQPEYKDLAIDLVFNGDTFDFLKIDISGKFPHHIDSSIALIKFERVQHSHRDFFEAIDQFIQFNPTRRRVFFLAGNHDLELFFPSIQQEIQTLCGGVNVFFPGFELNLSDLHIEHGNQQDFLFFVPTNEIFVRYLDKDILNLPWASVSILNAVLPIRQELYGLDRIKPRELVFEILPELKEFLLGKLWEYWAKKYVPESLRASDPLKRVTWSMVKEAFKRSFLSFSSQVEINDYYKDVIKRYDGFRTCVFGHGHESGLWSYGNRKIIRSGCFRNEFMYSTDDHSYHLMPKSYVEVMFQNGRVATSNLLEVLAPPLDPIYYPQPLKSYRSQVKALLDRHNAPPQNAQQTSSSNNRNV